MLEVEKPKIGTVTVSEQILISAVRYAVGRRTYMVSVTIEEVYKNLRTMSKKAMSTMYLDISREDNLGDDMDKTEWIALANVLADKINKSEPAK